MSEGYIEREVKAARENNPAYLTDAELEARCAETLAAWDEAEVDAAVLADQDERCPDDH